jgi:hypothetical protein
MMGVRIEIFWAVGNKHCEHPTCQFYAYWFKLTEILCTDGEKRWYVNGYCDDHKPPEVLNDQEIKKELVVLEAMIS